MYVKPESCSILALDPIEIAEVIDNLAARVAADANADLLGPWLLARAASALGITVMQTATTNPVEVVQNLGADWASMILETNREHPEDAHQVLLAAHAAFDDIRRGMQPSA